MVEYRLRPEHAEQVRTIRAESQKKLAATLAALSAEIAAQMQPIFSFYGVKANTHGYIEDKDGDVSICLPEATTASAL